MLTTATATATMTTIIYIKTGSGPAQMLFPYGVAVSEGVYYVVDFGNHRIAKFDKVTYQCLGTFGTRGNGPGQLTNPNCIAIEGSNVYVSDGNNHRVAVSRKLERSLL